MIPEFMKIRVMLVQRRDHPGMFGVAVRGGRFVCPLPTGYDGKTDCNIDNQGWVLVTHPTMPPLLADPTTGDVHPVRTTIDIADFTRPDVLH